MLRIILTFILIYLIFRILTTFVFPWLVNRYLKRFRDRYYQNNPGFNQQQRQREGEVHVSGTPPVSKKDELGEYVDFEEIKEDKDKGGTDKGGKESKEK